MTLAFLMTVGGVSAQAKGSVEGTILLPGPKSSDLPALASDDLLAQPATHQDLARSYDGWTFRWRPDDGGALTAIGRLPVREAPEAFVARFVDEQRTRLGMAADDLIPIDARRARRVLHRFYHQSYHGIEVDGARLEFAFSHDGHPIYLSSRTAPDIALLELSPTLSLTEAQEHAFDDMTSPTGIEWSDGTLVVLPKRFSGLDEDRLAWRMRCRTTRPEDAWRVLVDAHDGTVLERQSLTIAADPVLVEGKVQGKIHAPTTWGEETLIDLPEIGVAAQEGEVSLGEVLTDEAGQFSFGTLEIGDPGELNLVSTLVGSYAVIFEDRLFSPLREMHLANPTLPATILWDSTGATEPSIAAYYHTYTAHARFKSFDPSFTALDLPVWVVTNSTDGGCNAYATLNPDFPMMTFLHETETCPNTAMLQNVVYHEYGHLATMYSYLPEWPNSTLHEGFSDYFAATIDDTSTIGIDFRGPGTYLRELDNDMVAPLDPSCLADPHCEGLLIAGALWDMRSAFVDHLADRDEAIQYSDHLFHFMRYGRPMDFDACLVQLLLQDDDDGDLSNGTPNLELIAVGFEHHGIGDFDVRITHVPLHDTEDTTHPQQVAATLGSIYPLDPSTIQLHYKTGDEVEFTELTMTGSVYSYEQEIPAQPEGTVVEYYLSASDVTGRTATLPADAPATTFSFVVGTDTTPPEIAHETQRDLTTDQGRIWLWAEVSDNIGVIDSVWAEVTVPTGGGKTAVRVDMVAKDPEHLPGLFEGVFDHDPFDSGTVIPYVILAQDGSSQKNQARFPEEGQMELGVQTGRYWDLEDGSAGLSIGGDWEAGHPGPGPAPARSGESVLGTVLDGAYSVGLRSSVITPEIDLTQWDAALLEFHSWYLTEENWDGGRIRISTDHGSSWDLLTPGDGYPNWIYDPDNPFQAPVLRAFTGDGRQWRPVLVALDQYLGQTIQIRFDFLSDGSVVDLGWFLDDVTILESQGRVAPIWLDASTGEDGQVTLSWSEPIGIDTTSQNFDGYVVYRSTELVSEPAVEIAHVDETSYVDTEVENGTQYAYAVSCLYSTGESPNSPQAVGYPYRAGLSIADQVSVELEGVASVVDTLRIENAGTGELHLDLFVGDQDDRLDTLIPQFDPDGVDDDAPTLLLEDPVDAPAPDLADLTCTESAGELTFRFALHDSVPNPQEDFTLMLYFDTDLSRTTGLADGNVGADFMVAMGAVVYEEIGLPAFILFALDEDRIYAVGPPTAWDLNEGSSEISVTVPTWMIGSPTEIGIGAHVLMPGEGPFARGPVEGAGAAEAEKAVWSRLRQALEATLDEEEPMGDVAPDRPQSRWLEIGALTAMATPEDPIALPLSIDFSGWDRGEYAAKVLMKTNDPDQPTDEVAVEVQVWYLPPEGLSYWATSSDEDGLLLEWAPTEPDSVEGFLLRRWSGDEVDEPSAPQVEIGPIVSLDDSLYTYLDRGVEDGQRYFYRLLGLTTAGDTLVISPPVYPLYDPSVPVRLAMQPPWPNPARSAMTFRVHAPESNAWELFIVDVSGRRIRNLVRKGEMEAGIHLVAWDGKNENGKRVGQGVYYAVARVAGTQVTRSVLLVR